MPPPEEPSAVSWPRRCWSFSISSLILGSCRSRPANWPKSLKKSISGLLSVGPRGRRGRSTEAVVQVDDLGPQHVDGPFEQRLLHGLRPLASVAGWRIRGIGRGLGTLARRAAAD